MPAIRMTMPLNPPQRAAVTTLWCWKYYHSSARVFMLSESLWVAAAVLLAYALFCVVIGVRWQRRQPQFDTPAAPHELLIAYASQGGAAERIARLSAAGLHGSSLAVRVLPLNRVDEQVLSTSRKALFIVSTY